MTEYKDEAYPDIIDGEIKRLETMLDHKADRLRFSARMERQFREHYNHVFSSYRKISLFILISVIVVVGLVDLVTVKHDLYDMLIIRYAFGAPVAILIGLLMISRYFIKYQQEIVTQSSICTGLTVSALLMIAPDSVYLQYCSIYILLVIYIGVGGRLVFNRALVSIVVSFVSFNIVILFLRTQPIEVVLPYNVYFLCAAVMTLAANYHMERGVRREFIHEKILNLERSQLREANLKLARMATIDPLTGIDNRRQLENQLKKEWKRCLREEKSISIVMTDIDSFKKFNDNYGHQAGDDCLETVAKSINETFKRSVDIVARYGGEEFVIVLPDTSEDVALKLAKNMCQNTQNLNITHDYSDVAKHITLSAGVASCKPSKDISYEKLLSQADKALYKAKTTGKNQALIFSQS